jgi:branched-chain amino acid transport system substrate-binding protein
VSRISGHILAACLTVLALAVPAFAPPARADEAPVKIGVLNTQTGGLAAPAGLGSVVAARMAIEDFGGSVNGKPIELVSADMQNKPDIALGIARKWFDAEGVDMIVDLPNTAVALAVTDLAHQRDKLAIVSTAASAAITGKFCTPNSFMWTYNTNALAGVITRAMVAQGGKSWYLISTDYTFGRQLERDVSTALAAVGGTYLGSIAAPQEISDFSSYLLKAQTSGAQVVGLANVASDTINSIKQAHEFGLVQSGQKLAALLITIDDIDSLGLDVAQSLYVATSFYWDRTPETRAFAKRFFERQKAMPSMMQAGVYSAVTHYLQAVQRTGTKATGAVIASMRATPIHDVFADDGHIRADGLMVHDIYLAQVKTPSEQKYAWDYYKIVATIPADQAFGAAPSKDCTIVPSN